MQQKDNNRPIRTNWLFTSLIVELQEDSHEAKQDNCQEAPTTQPNKTTNKQSNFTTAIKLESAVDIDRLAQTVAKQNVKFNGQEFIKFGLHLSTQKQQA